MFVSESHITSHTIWSKIQTIDRQDKCKGDSFNVPDMSGSKIINNLHAVLSAFDQSLFQVYFVPNLSLKHTGNSNEMYIL